MFSIHYRDPHNIAPLLNVLLRDDACFFTDEDYVLGGFGYPKEGRTMCGRYVRTSYTQLIVDAAPVPDTTANLDPRYTLARIRGQSLSSLFFSIFGGLWLAVGFYALDQLTRRVEFLLIMLTLGLLVATAWLLRSVPQRIELDPQRQRDRPRFEWVNAAQGVALFAVFVVSRYLNHPDAAFPLAVLIVGLHFFALPRSYRPLSTQITGGLLVLTAALCPILFRGDAMVGAVTLCAGLTLWCSATWALRAAVVLLRGSHEGPDRAARLA